MSEPVKPEGREVRADARDIRADARDVRADVADTELKDRGLRTDVREDTVSEREGSISGAVKMIRWLTIVLVVISAGNFVRSFFTEAASEKAVDAAHTAEEASNRAETTSVEGRDASLETLAELRAILARINENNEDEPDLTNQAIIEALQTIARIEAAVCDGPCPEPG
jgi:hypothetical protein